MNTQRLSDEQKVQIRKKATETLQELAQAKASSLLYKEQICEQADNLIANINQNLTECNKKNKIIGEQRSGMIDDLQDSILSSDINATISLIEQLKNRGYQ